MNYGGRLLRWLRVSDVAEDRRGSYIVLMYYIGKSSQVSLYLKVVKLFYPRSTLRKRYRLRF